MGFKSINISKITKFKEMFDGRIKTLNPLIYASLLYIRDNKNHKKQFLKLNIPEINIIVVNLYPFEKYYKSKIYRYIIINCTYLSQHYYFSDEGSNPGTANFVGDHIVN